MQTITEYATIYDANGYITAQGATIYDIGDAIVINATEHAKSDLTISSGKIESIRGWSATI